MPDRILSTSSHHSIAVGTWCWPKRMHPVHWVTLACLDCSWPRELSYSIFICSFFVLCTFPAELKSSPDKWDAGCPLLDACVRGDHEQVRQLLSREDELHRTLTHQGRQHCTMPASLGGKILPICLFRNRSTLMPLMRKGIPVFT